MTVSAGNHSLPVAVSLADDVKRVPCIGVLLGAGAVAVMHVINDDAIARGDRLVRTGKLRPKVLFP